MSKGHRTERVGEEIKKIISEMLLKDIKDPRLTERMISITAVDVSPDLGYAHVFIDILMGKNVSDEERKTAEQEVIDGFESCTGHIRKELSTSCVYIMRLSFRSGSTNRWSTAAISTRN